MGLSECTRLEDNLQCGILSLATKHLHLGCSLVVCLVENLTHIDYHIHLVGTVLDGHSCFEHLHLEECLRRGESAHNTRDAQWGSVDSQANGLDKWGIYANRSHILQVGIVHSKLGSAACKLTNRLLRVTARQGGEVDGREAEFIYLHIVVGLGLLLE